MLYRSESYQANSVYSVESRDLVVEQVSLLHAHMHQSPIAKDSKIVSGSAPRLLLLPTTIN